MLIMPQLKNTEKRNNKEKLLKARIEKKRHTMYFGRSVGISLL